MNKLPEPVAWISPVMRLIESRIVDMRWLERADGTRVLQVAQPWIAVDKSCAGIEWRDVPVIPSTEAEGKE